MSYLTDLIAYRNAVAAKLAALDLDSLNYSVDGRSLQHDTHRTALEDALEKVEARILRARGAVEISTIVLS